MNQPATATASPKASIGLLVTMAAVRLGSMFVLLKVLSAMFGPDRFGILSQVMAVSAVFYMFAGGGVNNGVVKHVASSPSQYSRDGWLSAAATVAAVTSVLLALIAVLTFLFASDLIFADAELAQIFLIIGAGQALIGAGNVFLSYLSGTGDLKRFVLAHALGNLVMMFSVAAIAFAFGFRGAVIGSSLLPLGPALIALIFLTRYLQGLQIKLRKPKRREIDELLKFGGVLLITVTAVPLVHLYMRGEIAHSIGWGVVGQWQAVARLSDAYMQVYGILFINLLLPQLSKADLARKFILTKYYAAAFTGLFIAGASVLAISKASVLRIVFSEEFIPAGEFLEAQLLGDFFKICSLFIVYYCVSIGRLGMQIICEVGQGCFTLLFFEALRSPYGAYAPVYSHAAACLLVFLLAFLLMNWRASSVTESK